MNQIYLFIDLIRLKKPIGFMLLFWPCAWGLTVAYDFSGEKITYFFYLFLFLSGAILMRSAGCIINDIADKEYDKKVIRTKNRPIANGNVSVKRGFIYSSILCLVALLVLLQFNNFTILLALGSMPLAFTYPLMKRYTYWPQLFLGITFNYGLILGWTSITSEINLLPMIFYFGAIFWTLGFDTIYGFQDIIDDEIIGLKSTSIKFKKNSKLFVSLCYSIFLISLIFLGVKMDFNYLYYVFIIIIGFHLFYVQVYALKINRSSNCLKIFKSNNLLGGIVFLGLILGKIN